MNEMTEVEFARQLLQLDSAQLTALLDDTIGRFLEYRDEYGYGEGTARSYAIAETMNRILVAKARGYRNDGRNR